jgi:hypothetical protein
MDHREVDWGGMDWIDLALDRNEWSVFVNKVINLREAIFQHPVALFMSQVYTLFTVLKCNLVFVFRCE